MSSRLKIVVLVAVIALSGRLVWRYVIPSWNTIVTDFPNYYVSAWAVRHREPLNKLYDPIWFEQEKRKAGIERPAALFNYFPPANALIMWPVANLKPIGAKRVWTVVNLIALIAVIHLTGIASGLSWPVAALLALLGGDALGNNFAYGQFYIVLTLLMLCGVLFAKSHPSVAGVASAVGAATKIFPGFLLVYFAFRRNYRALMWTAAAFAGIAVLGLIAMGWEPHGTYLSEVLARTLRGEIQDPYNIHWNTLQALLRRALVGDELLNPHPIIDRPGLFFFMRPLISLAAVAATLYAIAQGRRREPLLAYGALIAMVSVITPSQASYHQFLFYPAIAGWIAIERSTAKRLLITGVFALICSNVMGATARFDSGAAMLLAFPRAWLVLGLWILSLIALDPPMLKVSRPLAVAAAVVAAILVLAADAEDRRWIAEVSDGAVRVPLESPDAVELRPRFVEGRLVTSALGSEGFADALQDVTGSSTSPDGQSVVFATNDRGNWDIAIRSKRTGEIRYLTSSSANDVTPTYSPDGKFVYFASDRHRGYRFTTIYRISVDPH
jgi:hypothetical protein